MATVNFLFRSTKDEARLNLRLLFRYNDADYVLGVKTKLIVSKHFWSKLYKSNSKDINIQNKQTEINSELNKITNHIIVAFDKVSNPSTLTKDWLQKQISFYYEPNQKKKDIPTDLIGFIDYYIEKREKNSDVKPTSIKKYYVIKNKLLRFEAFRKVQIFIKDIDEDFKDEFESYYLMEQYSKNTMHREFVIIKTFCKYAKAKGLGVHSEMEFLKFDREVVPKLYLNFDELEIIEDKKLEHDYLENARDWLIISCYTGQRVSDFMRFNKDMIRIENGKQYLEFRQVKTSKLMTVALHPKVVEILNKRSGDFPRAISDQKYNDYLKDVCRIAEIDEMVKGKKNVNVSKDKKTKKYRSVLATYPKHELITSHIGRRSFSSNFYGAIPTTLLINVTGHTTEGAFLHYLGKSNKDLAIELTNYF